MGKYVDGFVLPVPRDQVDEYRKLAQRAGEVWCDHGALRYTECVAEDVQPGKVTSFPQAVQLREDETVVFSWIEYKSRAHRDEVNEKAMNDSRLADMDPKSMPFDAMRMFWGGFEKLVEFGGD